MYQAIKAAAPADKASMFDLDDDLDGFDTDFTRIMNRNMFTNEWKKLIVEETADDFSKLKFEGKILIQICFAILIYLSLNSSCLIVPNLPNPKSVATEQNKGRASFPYIPNALVDLISSTTFT